MHHFTKEVTMFPFTQEDCSSLKLEKGYDMLTEHICNSHGPVFREDAPSHSKVIYKDASSAGPHF